MEGTREMEGSESTESGTALLVQNEGEGKSEGRFEGEKEMCNSGWSSLYPSH